MTWVIAGTTAAMLAAGAAKSAAVDAPRADRQRKLAAETQRYSPWTGMSAEPVKEADYFGNMLQFGTTGAMLGQGVRNMGLQADMQGKMGSVLDSEIARNNAMAAHMGQGSLSPGGVPTLTGPAAQQSPWMQMGGYEDPLGMRSIRGPVGY